MAHTVSGLLNVTAKKLSKNARKTGPRRVNMPWRQKPAKRQKLTYLEKKQLLEKRLQTKDRIRKRVEGVHDLVFEEAIKMAEDFPRHDAKYWYRYLFSQSNLKLSEPREITMWNAFVSLELTRLNKGT